MGKHETGFERVERDLYPTRESWVADALFDHVDVRGRTVWEFAAGTGCLVEHLKAAGASVYCSDIFDYGYPLDALFDFTVPGNPGPEPDLYVTNPPCGKGGRLAAKFIEAGLRRIKRRGILCLLLPVDFDSAIGRPYLFRDCPLFRGKIVLTRRPIWFSRTDGKREAPKENYCWNIWQSSALRLPPVLLYGPLSKQAKD